MNVATYMCVSTLVLGAIACDSNRNASAREEGDGHGHAEAPAADHEGEAPEGSHHDHAEGGHDEHEESVRLSPEAIERSQIVVGGVSTERLVGGIRVPAEVTLNPDRTAHITPLVAGRIDEVNASLGDHVKKGQILAKLRSVSLGEARSQVAQARASVEVARASFLRQETLQKEGIGSRRAFLEAQGEYLKAQAELTAAKERVKVYGGGGGRGGKGSVSTVRSPLDGVIIERHATPGEVVSVEGPMFVVADLGRVWVVGRLYEQDVATATTGAAAVVTLPAYPERSWQGEVSYVASTLDPATRTLPVRVELDNSEGVLRPGLFGTIALSKPVTDGAGHEDSKSAAVSVPQAAVQRIEGKNVVFVPGDEPGEFRAVPVVLGVKSNGRVEVTRGLQAGDRVVTMGAFTLKSELQRSEMGEGHAH